MAFILNFPFSNRINLFSENEKIYAMRILWHGDIVRNPPISDGINERTNEKLINYVIEVWTSANENICPANGFHKKLWGNYSTACGVRAVPLPGCRVETNYYIMTVGRAPLSHRKHTHTFHGNYETNSQTHQFIVSCFHSSFAHFRINRNCMYWNVSSRLQRNEPKIYDLTTS